MTKLAVKHMIKLAKKTAKDSAMELAADLGKPTSSGLVAGAGLGTILAAIGAIKRNGEDPDDRSVLSNPLLLGSLGAAGGYLAGNAFENTPTVRAHKDLSTSALLSLIGGTGLAGTMLAKQDAEDALKPIESHFKTITRKMPFKVKDGVVEYQPKKLKRNASRKAKEQARKDFLEFNKTKEEYSTALRRAGKYQDAKTLTGYTHPDKLGRRFIEGLKNSPMSPVSWLRALNPAKKSVTRNGEAGLRLLRTQLGKVIRNNPKKSSLAALALLAGGGKALYDYTSD